MGEPYPYDIKAIPTVYEGVRFRSRLEARWAALFDFRGFAWDYEPIDFDGWAPDFKLVIKGQELFVEVKPINMASIFHDSEMDNLQSSARNRYFGKALNHRQKVWVMLLGLAPPGGNDPCIGLLCDHPAGRGHSWLWSEVYETLAGAGEEHSTLEVWRRAGTRVQWRRDD